MKVEIPILISLLFLAVFLQFTPLLTRRGIFFSATVDPAFPRSNDGRRVLRSYRRQAALWSVLAIAIALALLSTKPSPLLLLPMIVLVVGSSLSYWRKFREVHERYGVRAPNVRYAELMPGVQQTGLNLWLSVPPIAWLVGVAAYLQAHWSDVPERFPVHWGADGQPNGWATRSFHGVYGPVLMALFMNAFCVLLAVVLLRLSRNTTMRHVTVTMVLLVMYPLSFSLGMVALLPLVAFPMWLIPAVTLAFVGGLVVWSARKIIAPSSRDVVPEPRSDAYWKAGLFYYNPEDPAIFVSKRVGIGYTMNFANKMSWLVLAGLVLVLLAPALLLRIK